ncbi:MAG: hypothetical protein Q4C30_10210 [Bacteroidia bacterium]|nr:hypothetical protein [Bacteroidia bacterium]
MRLFLISIILLSSVLSGIEGRAASYFDGDGVWEDSVYMSEEQLARYYAYEKRLEKRNDRWNALLPDCFRFQVAGSVGLVNLGLGWHYGKNDRWETDFMFGFVPSGHKEDALVTFTLRETMVPWRLMPFGHTKDDNSPHFTIEPLTYGIFFNTILKEDYWTKEPKRYPGRYYYRFSTKVRCHLFVGQRYGIHIPKDKRWMFKEVDFVWELSTADMYAIAMVQNQCVTMKDIMSLSLGVKLNY